MACCRKFLVDAVKVGRLLASFTQPGTPPPNYEADDNPLGVRACKHVIPDWSFAGHGACQMGLWLNVGVWVISLLWVPAVYNKLYRGVIKFLAGDEAPDAGSKKQAKPRTKKAD